MEHNQSTQAITCNYVLITEKAKSEILRLSQFGKMRNSTTENPEIYCEWAYGVFLFWKSLVGSSATPADLLSLEMLATGEQQI